MGKSKVLAMHQCNFLPWVGYFHKMMMCDVFLVLDSVQVPRGRSYASRTKLKTPGGWGWLTIPLPHKGKYTYVQQPLEPIRFWSTRLWKTLECNYARAPYWNFEDFEGEWNKALNVTVTLMEFNYVFLKWARQILDIDTQLVFQSVSGIEDAKDGIAVQACRIHRCDTYLSGVGALDYNDPQAFEDAGIELRYQEFECPQYPQLWGGFVPDLSIVDLIFNCGPEAKEMLRRS